MMCERCSCKVLNTTRRSTVGPAATKLSTAIDCKCHLSIFTNRKQKKQQQQSIARQQPFHSTPEQHESNVNMIQIQSQQQQLHHSQQQQQQQQEMVHHVIQEMSFATNNYNGLSCHTTEIAQTPTMAAANSNTHNIVTTASSNANNKCFNAHSSNRTYACNINANTSHNNNGHRSDISTTLPGLSTTPSLLPSSPAVPHPTGPAISNGNDDSVSPSIGVNLRVTGQCSQGGRKYMEDYFSVAYQQSENAKDLEYAFIGIYDGHGGAEAATFAKEHLMMQIINQKLFWSDSDQDVLRAIREGYIATHFAMWRDQEKWPKTANGLLSTAGTTATIAFIRREKIYIGHVGDSGIVLGYQNEDEHFWRAKQLTVDHKPESVAERQRIIRSGGKVVVKSGVPRVVWNRPRNACHRGPIRRSTPVDEVPFLAVARSLGDLWSYNSACNEFVVSPDPDVRVIKIDSKTFRCLIFGTDGLWNVVTPQEAVDTVFEKETLNERLQAQGSESVNAEWTNPSKGLVERALKTWSAKKMRADNTSVVTVILYPPNCIDASEIVGNNQMYYEALPNNCGLEYSQVCAEIPTNDYNVTYQELAEKYLPPEDFRHFNFFEDLQEYTSMKDENGELLAGSERFIYRGGTYWMNSNYNENAHCGDYHRTSLEANSDLSICHSAILGGEIETEVNDIDEDETEEDDIEDDDSENITEEESKEGTHKSTKNCNANYASFNSDASTSNVDNSTNSSLNNTGYMSSFAESYNSLLNEQMSHEAANNSNSNSNCQSITGTHMHEILKEQQLYQQQCMSEEEGYSLTKLETRREQQHCSGVQTFKIFQTHDTVNSNYNPQQNQHQHQHHQQSHQQQPQQPHQITVDRELEEALTWEPRGATLSGAMHRFLSYQHTQQKPLELNSLLQQEREEEEQVAFERFEMQRQLAHANAVAIESGTDNANSSSAHNYESMVAQQQQHKAKNTTDSDLEEYLEDDSELQMSSSSQLDETVQINEISSSMTDSTDCSSRDTPSPETTQASASGSRSTIIEKLEKDRVELPRFDRPDHPLTPHKSPPLPMNLRIDCISTSTSTSDISSPIQISRPPKACPARTSLKRSQTNFPNIPNENAQLSDPTMIHTLRKRRRFDRYNTFKPVVNGNTDSMAAANGRSRRCNSALTLPRNTSGCSLEKRQLRSSSVVADYSKRTLRTRNTLSKEMKAKSNFSATLKRNASQYLHETAVTLMNTNSVLARQRQRQQQQQQQQQQRSQRNTSSLVTSTRKARTEKLTSSPLSHVINLRSRKISQLSDKTMVTNSATTTTAAAAHRRTTALMPTVSVSAMSSTVLLRHERPNLRRLSARTAASSNSSVLANSRRNGYVGNSACAASNYSKTTRLQATVSAYARSSASVSNVSTPTTSSSKLLNRVAAVAMTAATRSRTLHLTKQTGAAAPTKPVRSNSATFYGKRTQKRNCSNVASNGTIASTSSSVVAGGGGGAMTRGRRSSRRMNR